MSFKKNYERICFEKRLKPSAVCEAIGLARSTYSLWNDDSIPRKSTLGKLAAYLNVTVNDLLAEEQPDAASNKTQKEKAPIESDEGGEESIKDYLHRLVDRMDDDGARDLLSHAEEIVLQRPKNLK